jgi:hypothetical protein
LLAREATAIYAVVDLGIDPLVQRVDLRTQRLGVEIDLGVLGESVELAVLHADDLGRLVVDDSLALAVPEHRDRDGPLVVGCRCQVDLT